MEVDSAAIDAARGGWDRDMDVPVDRAQELPEGSGGVVTENRAISACQDGGHPASVVARGAVTHGVDTSMHPVESSVPRPF